MEASRQSTVRPWRRALVVANPIAGRGLGERTARAVAAGLAAGGVPAEVFLTRARGEAEAHLAHIAEDVDLVVAVGGDGTVREILAGLPDGRRAVGIVPLGTANVMSLDLGLPRAVERAVPILLRGNTTPVDVGRVNGHLTFLVTGVGLDGFAVHEVEARRRGPIRKWSYVGAGLRALGRYREPRLAVSVDGERLSGTFGWVLVSNVVHYAGLPLLARDRILDDGLYEVYLFRRASLLHLALHLVRGLLGRLPGGGCERRRARRVRIESELPVACQVDGDAHGTTPVEFVMEPARRTLVIP